MSRPPWPRSKSCGVADQRLVFDTNVLWHALLPSQDPIAPTCERLMKAVDDGEIRAYCSALSLVELPKVIRPDLSIDQVVALTERLRASDIIPVTAEVALRAREVGLERELAPAYDAVILATAIEVRASALYTYDRDDFPVDQTIDGVRISTPVLPPDLAQTSLEVE